VIRVGVEGTGDVRLPADASDREIELACQLLAEVVRLRRKDHALTRSRKRLVEQALSDPLTGLPNRRAWDRALEEQVAAAGSPGTRLCLAILDLDHFKRVNDAQGHAAGDDVLRAAGEAIAGGLRESDFVARLGGDEFGLLLRARDEAMGRAVVDRVRQSIPLRLSQSGTHRVTASAGFALTPSGAMTSPLPCPDALFRAADTALSQAKRQGRDRTVGASESV
jgi:diguanylate cyclase (GGDEF)-like protein